MIGSCSVKNAEKGIPNTLHIVDSGYCDCNDSEKGIPDTVFDSDSENGQYDHIDDFDFEGGVSNDRLDIQQMDLQEKLQRWWNHSEQYLRYATPQHLEQFVDHKKVKRLRQRAYSFNAFRKPTQMKSEDTYKLKEGSLSLPIKEFFTSHIATSNTQTVSDLYKNSSEFIQRLIT